jgi:hypothetical protein
MKKAIVGLLAAGFALGAFGQGTVILENADGTGYVTLNGPYDGNNAAGTYQVALLWYNGTSFQQVGAVYQTSSYNNDSAGYFFGELITLPGYARTGTFEVEGWTGNYPNYASAVANGNGVSTYAGLTGSFTSGEGNPNGDPPGGPPIPPFPLSSYLPSAFTGNWDGNLVLQLIPEPSPIALGGFGGVALWMFRRRK